MSGYDYEPKSNSPYLRLKSKGEKIKIRLASEPIMFLEDYKDKETGEVKTNERWAWIVIDRADNEVKAYKAGVMVFKGIKGYAKDEDWGDPTGYDLTIERTEEQGRYYVVTASPKTIRPLSAEEKKMVEESGIDLRRMFKLDEAPDPVEPEPEEEIDIDELPFDK